MSARHCKGFVQNVTHSGIIRPGPIENLGRVVLSRPSDGVW
jgi:hypothetical protein